MTKITEIKVLAWDGTEEIHVVIDHGNNQFTSMPKAIFDAEQANQK